MPYSEDKSEITAEEPRLTPDPFALLRRIQSGVAKCSKLSSCGTSEPIEYLWLYVSRGGIGQADSHSDVPHLELEHWLNVVDEAAALGAKWLVISSFDALPICEDVWHICSWAQDTHGMLIGLHTNAPELTADDIASLAKLAPERTRLLVSESAATNLGPLTEAGIQVVVCKPEISEPAGDCAKPGKMAFVNPRGEMYTCALVEGFGDYRLGTVFEGAMAKALIDPTLPHSVPSTAPHVEHGCAGCPPLMAQYFKE